MYLLGVDSGGTKTKSIVVDSNFNIQGKGEGGPGSYRHVGKKQAKKNISDAIKEALFKASLKKADIEYGGFGIGGLDTKKDYKIISKFIKELNCAKKVYVVNDVVIAHYGTTAGKPGVTVVAGTGSIAYGFNEKGEEYRAGGWDWLIGDEGGGFYAAKRGLQEVSKTIDGRKGNTKLVELAKSHFKMKNVKEELMDKLMDKVYKKKPQEIASFAKCITEAASSGDKVAIEIINECSQELVDLVKAVQKKLEITNRLRIGYVGGFISSNLVLKKFKEKIKQQIKNYKIMKPLKNPVVGAISLIFNKINKKIKIEDIQKMDRQIERDL